MHTDHPHGNAAEAVAQPQRARLHPSMQPFVQWFAPAANAEPLQAFFVRFIRGGIVEAQFEAMATDSIACVQQHVGAANGAKVDVRPLSSAAKGQP